MAFAPLTYRGGFVRDAGRGICGGNLACRGLWPAAGRTPPSLAAGPRGSRLTGKSGPTSGTRSLRRGPPVAGELRRPTSRLARSRLLNPQFRNVPARPSAIRPDREASIG